MDFTPNLDHHNIAELVSADQGKLVIACSNSACASQIKHLQQSLLGFLHEQGFVEIKQLAIRIKNKRIDETPKSQAAKKNTATHLSTTSMTTPEATSSNSLDAIKHCQKMVANEQLAKSLGNLAKTLKGNK
jgi:hypothetical protein